MIRRDVTHDAAGTASEPLEAINRELAEFFSCKPAELVLSPNAAFADDLVLCGLLGGKDVGKSTLINALAGTCVSAEHERIGRGTDRPVAYLHGDASDCLRARLDGVLSAGKMAVATHDLEAIRNIVLIDLPDFDSAFRDHLDTVREIVPLLDRVLWVLTPRKIGDRTWVRLFREVVKDPRNVHCVLNKVDELLADERLPQGDRSGATRNGAAWASSFWSSQIRWMAHMVEEAGFPHAPEHRFLVAAAFPEPSRFVARVADSWDDPDWACFGEDRAAVERIAELASHELDRLRQTLLSPVTREEAGALKKANLASQLRFGARRLRQYYDLDRTLAQIESALDPRYHREILREAFREDDCVQLALAIQSRMAPERELADRLLEVRVDQWPLLRLVYWPFGWLARALGRRASARMAVSEGAPDDRPELAGASLGQRIELLQSRIQGDFPVLVDRFHLDSEIPESSRLARVVEDRLRNVAADYDERVLEEIRRGDRKPGIVGKGALWLTLLWFPLLQPALEAALAMTAAPGAKTVAEAGLILVRALSATHLAASFGVVVLIYLALLAGIYARCLRAVRGGRAATPVQEAVAEAVDELLISSVVLPTVEPWEQRCDQLRALAVRLEEVEGRADSIPAS